MSESKDGWTRPGSSDTFMSINANRVIDLESLEDLELILQNDAKIKVAGRFSSRIELFLVHRVCRCDMQG